MTQGPHAILSRASRAQIVPPAHLGRRGSGGFHRCRPGRAASPAGAPGPARVGPRARGVARQADRRTQPRKPLRFRPPCPAPAALLPPPAGRRRRLPRHRSAATEPRRRRVSMWPSSRRRSPPGRWRTPSRSIADRSSRAFIWAIRSSSRSGQRDSAAGWRRGTPRPWPGWRRQRPPWETKRPPARGGDD